jgi:lipoprotein-anchoring transpeptidase ErfK/SrfK
MSRTKRYSLGLSALLLALSATTLPVNAQGHLGGGFIEFLVTGGARGPAQAAPQRGPAPRASQAALHTGSASLLPDDPYQQPILPGQRRGPGQDLAPMPQTGFDPRYERQTVDYSGPHRPGTIVVDTPNRFLYLVQPGGKALRYGIGVGRPGFEWAGSKAVTRKAEWPDWRPPPEMLKRRPDLPTFMAGGPDNPLGARALYLGSSLYRIHGTNEPSTIGQAVSSGCIRMRNEDVTDLYERVRVGQRVVVI